MRAMSAEHARADRGSARDRSGRRTRPLRYTSQTKAIAAAACDTTVAIDGAAHAPTEGEHEERIERDVEQRRRALDHHRRPHVALAGQDRAQEGGEHQEHVAAYDRTEERPGQRHEIGRARPSRPAAACPQTPPSTVKNAVSAEPEQEAVLGGAVGALGVARADVARHHRGEPAAQPEGDAEPEEDQRHVEGDRRQLVRAEHADEDHVDDHVDRLQRHPDHHRERHAPHARDAGWR